MKRVYLLEPEPEQPEKQETSLNYTLNAIANLIMILVAILTI